MMPGFLAPLALLASMPAAAAVDKPAAIEVPSAPPPPSAPDREDTPEEQLELSGRAMLSLLRAKTPEMRGPVPVSDDTRVMMVNRSGKTTFLTGEPMRAFIRKIFEPDDAVVFRFSAPHVLVDGRFGRFTRRIGVQEAERKAECFTSYADAVEAESKRWIFTQITFVLDGYSKPCVIVEE